MLQNSNLSRIPSRGYTAKSISVALLAGTVSFLYVLHASTADAAKERVLYSFCNESGCADGEIPYAGVINVNGTLYGTTYRGGANGVGTVFSLDRKTGAEGVLYSFQGGVNGSGPVAALLNVKGTLYGTTYGSGAVFSYDLTTGSETTLFDIGSPAAGLTKVKGTLYGTASTGGDAGEGTLFSYNLTTGTETTLYSFQNNGTDGTDPQAALVKVNGVLYGTTTQGGANGDGTIFSINKRTGAETVLHSFQGTDGADPQAGLIIVNGTLYGTAWAGGTGNCSIDGYDGCGTVFSFDPTTGAETTLYSFQGNVTDGAQPIVHGALININGTLYGTTVNGGTYTSGTIFSFDPKSDIETPLYSFGSGTDGSNPQAGLIYVKGTFYGTTVFGGNNGDGTVFSFVP